MECKYCIDNLDFNIKIADIETKCKYHKKRGQVYPVWAMVPKGMCRELFYAAYPASLAVLYNGKPLPWRPRKKGIDEMTATCVAPNGIKVKIKAKEILPAPLRILKELVEELCKKFYRAYDAPFRKVVIEVINKSPVCPKNYKAGNSFEFNIGKKDELCPAGFNAVYPYFRLLKEERKIEGSQGSLSVHCPDYVGVTYEVKAD